MAIRTSKNISKPLVDALERQNIRQDYMAHDLGMSKQTVSNSRNGSNTTPEKAVLFSKYLRDSKFNQQMAAAFFDAITVFDSQHWAKQFQNAPYATWVQLRHVEKRRMDIGEKVFDFGVKDRSEWTKQEADLAREWMIGLLKTTSLSLLMETQFADMAHYDLDSFIEHYNRLWGVHERK